MRIALIGLHFAEIVARLALALSRDNQVVVYVAERAANREWTPALRRELGAAVSVVYLPHPHRARALWHGIKLARAVARFAPDVVHVQEAGGWTILAFWLFYREGDKHRSHPSWPGLSRPFTRSGDAASAYQAGSDGSQNPRPHGDGTTWMAGASPAMTAKAAKTHDKKAPAFVLTVHDPAPHSGDLAARARTRWADAQLRRRADAVIVHGEALVPLMLATAKRVYAVPHGALGEPDRIGPPPGRRRFLMFGRLQAYKGLGVLLDAVEILTAQNRRFEVLIAGAGDDLDTHRARVAGLAAVTLDERYIPAAEVAALFESCDAVTTPYLDATQSGVGALAMAAGRALIATDVGALGELVRDGENGLLVPAGDAAALAVAMARLLDEPALAARLGRGARATAEGELSWARIAELTAQVYAVTRS